MVRKHMLFFGRVQGVGFRYYSVNKARMLGLTGWVRNLDDGSVEMEVQGSPQLIEELTDFLGQQRFVLIERIETKEMPTREERDFQERF